MKAGRIEDENFELFGRFFTPFVLERRQKKEPLALFGLTDNNTAIGAAALSFFDGSPELISLYVSRDYRERGGGTLLLQTVEKVLKELGVPFSVSFQLSGAPGKKLSAFFEKRGFTRVKDAIPVYRIPFSVILEKEIRHSAPSELFSIRSFSEASGTMLRNLSDYVIAKGLPAPREGFMGKNVNRELSLLCANPKGAPEGYLIVENTGHLELTISGLYQRLPSSPLAMSLLNRAFEIAKETCRIGTVILAAVIHPAAERFVHYFLPNAKNESYEYEKAL